MTDQAGTALSAFKTALFEQLYEWNPNIVHYESPADAKGINAEDGSRVGVWFLDDTTAEIEQVIATLPCRWDEICHPVVVVQAVGKNTDDTQQAIDLRATNALGAVIGALATADPVTATADFQIVRAVPESWTYTTGIDSQNMRGGRYELTIRLESRLTLEAP